MRCDVCNANVPRGSGERITPEIFTYLLDNGFGLDDENIKMLTDAERCGVRQTDMKILIRGVIMLE